MVYLIICDIKVESDNLDKIINSIKPLGEIKKLFGTCWLLDAAGTKKDENDIYDAIKEALMPGDRFIAHPVKYECIVGRTYASDGVWNWLEERGNG